MADIPLSNIIPQAGAWPVDKIDVILSSQSYTVPETGTYRVLVVGGGGSGGSRSGGKATGGGAGGFRYAEVALTVGQILTATIGAGGAPVFRMLLALAAASLACSWLTPEWT